MYLCYDYILDFKNLTIYILTNTILPDNVYTKKKTFFWVARNSLFKCLFHVPCLNGHPVYIYNFHLVFYAFYGSTKEMKTRISHH